MACVMLRALLLPPECRFSVGTLSSFDLATLVAASCAVDHFTAMGTNVVRIIATGGFKDLWAAAVTPDSGLAWLGVSF